MHTHACRGLTLIETAIALAILAIVATIALPGLGPLAERARLRSAAEALAGDLAEARFEAARLGRPLVVEATAGPPWCWGVATDPGCPCSGAAPSCRLKATGAADLAGIELSETHGVTFSPDGNASGAGGALFSSRHGEQLRVSLTTMGRARICAPARPVPGYPPC